ncbi:MAG: PAS domain S-box protein [Nitrospirae bacterium]|nr:PAS domain S-box protein [Nitrospirota bacterium]
MLIQEDYFKNIFNTVREAILILDENLRVLSANRSFYTIFKVNSEETIGCLLYDLGNEQWNIPHLRVLLEDILPKNNTVDNFEIEHNFESIGKKTMLLNACKIREKKNALPIILLAIEDITEHKRLEGLLTESEKRYRRVFETASDGIVLIDKQEGTITHTNPATEKILGYSREESIGKMLQDIGVSLDISNFQAIMQALDKGGILNYADIPVKTKSGQHIYTDIYMVDRAILAQCNIRDVTERRQSVEALRASKQLIEGIINAIPVRVFWKDKNLVYLGCNAAFARDAGFADPKDIIGKDDYQMGWRDQAELYRSDDRQVIENGVTKYLIEEPQTTPEGNIITLLTSKLPLRNFEGEIIGILGTYMDITEHKRADDALRESEERFRQIAESTEEWIWEVNSDGLYTYASHVVEKILGYNPEEIVGKKHFYDFYPSDKREQMKKEAFEVFATKRAFAKYVNSNTHKNGVIIILETSGAPILDSRGALLGYRGVDVDITERKKAEEDLQAALVTAHDEKNKSEAIIASMGEGLSIQDTDFNIIYENKIQKDIIGDHVGERCYKAYENKDHVCEGCPVALAFRDGNIHKTERAVTTGKGTLHVEITASPLRDIKGNIVAGIEIVRDITERKQTEEEKLKLEAQLRHAQKMEAVGTLAGGIAHDFNNILNVIIGYGTMLLDRIGDDPLSKEQMKEVLTAAERAANLTRGLLAFSRKQAVEVKPLNVNELILGIQKMLVRMIRENIDFRLNLTDMPLIVLADAGQIEQILMNLAANAKDAMPEGGHLTITTGMQELDDEYVEAYGYGKPGMYALITVTDTGHGMDTETQNKIFEPFFTTKGIGEGTGLGLAVSYGIIKQHNGYIKVYSEPGHGAEFKIYLPLIEESAALAKEIETPDALKGGNETILVAEDDASLRNLARIVLESYGYSVITSEDGEDAITKFMENRDKIQLVILDMIMPKKNGKEACEAIRKESPGIKILFASGYSMDNIKTSELTEAGFDFILKPVVPKDFLKKVREVLDK